MPNFLWRLVSILWHCRRGHIHGRRRITNSTSFLSPEDLSLKLAGSDLHVFTYAEMIAATKNFAPCNLVGSGGFGRVYKGVIDDGLRPRLAAQTVAVKYLEPGGVQGQREWQTEVMFLGRLRHPNLVKLIGYCYEKEHRMIVYEFVAEGSLETHLFRKPLCDPLPWRTRLKIAVGAAKGLAFLHEAEKPVIFRDFKASNILLDPVLGSVSDYTAKLSDFGLAKDGPEGDDTHISTSVMGTHGYVAPEYVLTGHLTAMSDVYSFGVVLLELLTGRQCFDGTRRCRERDLVCWAKRYLRRPKKKLYKIMDPRLQYYCQKDAEKAAMVACKCLSSNRKLRPRMRDVVEALEPLLESNYAPTSPAVGPVVTVEEDDEEGDEEKRDGEIIEIMSNGHKRASKFRYRCKQRFPSSAIHAETTTDFTSSVNHDQRCPGDQERGA